MGENLSELWAVWMPEGSALRVAIVELYETRSGLWHYRPYDADAVRGMEIMTIGSMSIERMRAFVKDRDCFKGGTWKKLR